jgi:hypothetical protein
MRLRVVGTKTLSDVPYFSRLAMKLTRLHVTVIAVVGPLAVALLVVALQGQEDAASPSQSAQAPTPPQIRERSAAMAPPESLPSCGAISPFGMLDTPCNPNITIAPSGGAAPGEASAETSVIGPVPDFVDVQVVGSVEGSGVAASMLKTAGRNLAATHASPDSLLVDTSNMSDVAVAAAVQDALKRGQYIIVDGKDSMESSDKLNKIMQDLNLPQMPGVTAYGLSKGADGKLNITPLQTVANEKGVRQINQIRNVLNINKT